MLEYCKDDEHIIVRNLINDLKPRITMTLPPGLPFYILFMCIWHTDFIKDADKFYAPMAATINAVKEVTKHRLEDLEITIMWLSNTLHLVNILKQYSGDKKFQAENTPKQNEQCIKHFDLTEYIKVFSDIAMWIYKRVIRALEERILPMVVPAILEHEAVPGLRGQTPLSTRRRSSSVVQERASPVCTQNALDDFIEELDGFHLLLSSHGVDPEELYGFHLLLSSHGVDPEELYGFHLLLSSHGVDPELIVQVLRQIFYLICATSLNHLLLKKELCKWYKGIQIRYNLSHLEQWVRDHWMQDTNVLDTLQPIIQAAQLLQVNKHTEEDVKCICDICDKLSMTQIITILSMFTSADDFEERVPIEFICKVQTALEERTESREQSTLLMDTDFRFPVRFPFKPSTIRLEDIKVPEVLNLPTLKKVR